ncbi:hypothetical protein CKO31_22520 [Thiohalocapsa halophila]|uniref:Uncharacterized protein n=1 Tax=Thiohalocapsa halophila TaxID=69359 RepID=A0ABS1CNR9_9GAMM|nr:hypothetical protein [Thiohalocapsa halophila]
MGAEVFDTILLKRACRIIRDRTISIAGLTGEDEITPVDQLTLTWFGLEVSEECRPISSGYGGAAIRLCPLTRLGSGCFQGRIGEP